MNNTLELKTINELRKMNFFIPSYQRGYRWSEKEVTELLNDISTFIPKQIDDNGDKKTGSSRFRGVDTRYSIINKRIITP
jgi:uncharacterized protein with ParB-like and HNH nuclease domain